MDPVPFVCSAQYKFRANECGSLREQKTSRYLRRYSFCWGTSLSEPTDNRKSPPKVGIDAREFSHLQGECEAIVRRIHAQFVHWDRLNSVTQSERSPNDRENKFCLFECVPSRVMRDLVERPHPDHSVTCLA